MNARRGSCELEAVATFIMNGVDEKRYWDSVGKAWDYRLGLISDKSVGDLSPGERRVELV